MFTSAACSFLHDKDALASETISIHHPLGEDSLNVFRFSPLWQSISFMVKTYLSHEPYSQGRWHPAMLSLIMMLHPHVQSVVVNISRTDYVSNFVD